MSACGEDGGDRGDTDPKPNASTDAKGSAKPDQGAGASAKNGAAPLQKRAFLRGIVRDFEGRPVAGATVEAKLDADAVASADFWRGMPRDFLAVAGQAKSGQDGRFEIPVEQGPLYSVLANKDGTKSNRARVYANRPFGLTIGAYQGEPSSSDEPERKGKGSISGRVLDKETGAPIAGALIRRAWRDEAFTKSDASGRYRVGWTSKIGRSLKTKEDKIYEAVFVIARGYQITALPSAAIMEGADTTHDVKLERGIGVRGRVVDANGKPVAGLRLVCEDDIFVEDGKGNNVQYGAVTWTRETDENGRWSFEEMHPQPPGENMEGRGSRYWVRGLTADGLAIELAEGRFGPGAKSIEIGDVPIGPMSSVRGKVTRKDGKAIEQAPKPGEMQVPAKVHFIRLFEKPSQPLVMRNTPWVPIDSAGNYRIPRLAPGRYELAYWVSDKLETEVRTVTIARQSQEHTIDVEIGAGRSFEGLVLDENDKPIDGALLRAYPDAKDEYFPLVPEGDLKHPGRFLQGNVRVLTKPDGTYLLTRIRSRVPILLVVAKEGYSGRKIRVEADTPPPPRIVLKKKSD